MGTPKSADVIVVGAGNAALVAALSAAEAGATVAVLEAAPKTTRGGNSRFSGGIFRIAHDGMDHLRPLLTDEALVWADKVELDPYPPERYLHDLTVTSHGQSDPALIGELVHRSYETVAWMKEQGVRWELVVDKLFDPDNFDPDETYTLPPGGALRATHEGLGLMHDLFAAVDATPAIEVVHDAPAHDLIMDGSACRGVRVRGQAGFAEYRGSVVLASGGFESNPRKRLQHLGTGWDLVKVRGTAFNMGTMLDAALDAGAAPSGHWSGAHASPLDADAPPVGQLALTDKLSRYSYPYGILLNRDGERFVDEASDEVWLTYAKTGSAIREQPGAWAVQIFDQRTVRLLEPRYSTANPVEADTIGELARKLDLPVAAAERTVEAYNAATTADGEFEPFVKDGRSTAVALTPPKSNWALPLDRPPFVAYPVCCGITFTYGGLHIDTDARVIDTTGRAMPNLYATGEIAGGFFYHNYPAGSGLVRGAVFGRIAGISAAGGR
ncbi:MAG: FAD-dependent tricarballylate dehydrogenase TcuA [Acidimicrobiia bacterium]|nr:FAD-dependent tricarballylate dehydrogenase TcuA [Acidimicrobiia bacterium]